MPVFTQGIRKKPAHPAEETIVAKKPSVRYWASRSAYCCEIDGTQHILAKGPNDGPKGKTYLAAGTRFGKLITLEVEKGTDDYVVSALFNQYRSHLGRKARPVIGDPDEGIIRQFQRFAGGRTIQWNDREHVTIQRGSACVLRDGRMGMTVPVVTVAVMSA